MDVTQKKVSSKQVHKTAQPSHTLMRKAVKKPSTITSRKTIAMDVVPHRPGQMLNEVFRKPSDERLERARSMPKSSVVSRFGDITNAVKKPIDMLSFNKTTRQVPKLFVPAEQPTGLRQPKPMSRTNSMLDKGMRAADSHNAPIIETLKLRHKVGKRFGFSKRTTSVVVGALIIATLGGFFVYQNIPNMNVRYAAAKAGVSGQLPSYQPAGFAVNSHVAYSPGKISIAYKANADSRSYTITQANTSWSSDALKDHLTTSGSQLQTYPQNGQTIYLHDSAQADWVNNGIWYSIAGSSSLNTDQLIKIASSI
jgi:hypothetical protein